ncbi:MAG: NAD(P)/FAD-dependent oxidoreductase [Thermoanaerobaculia bacterium]|nr:NAD(P)/FAD-dependent oxidoreductase [Thermoanaerobaculia bacterium]
MSGSDPAGDDGRDLDAIVVGAGFAGMYMLHRLRELGLSVRVFEAATGVGGTWYWNRYPGARCDVESMEYSYGFDEELQQEWKWTERYAAQPEILRYAEHVADRFDLRRDIQFETRVESVHFHDDEARWHVRTSGAEGEQAWTAQFCVMATGCLSTANTPDFPGLAEFGGTVLHTGRWPKDEPDLAGRTVGVVGTGSSGIQAIPLLAERCGELYVFQRTANYSIPARNRPLTAEEQAEIKAIYPEFREANRHMSPAFGSRLRYGEGSAKEADPEARDADFRRRWAEGGFGFLGGYTDFLLDRESNEVAAEWVRNRIRETVKDPEVAELLCPDQVIGCKRICLDTDYFETYNRPNVHLVDVSRQPIERITQAGLVAGGREYPLDVLVLATGFDAMTGTLLAIDIRGRGGKPLSEKWRAGPRTFLGLGIEGFPNLFTISGPGSPSVLTNMIVSIEQHVEWIRDCIAYLREHGLRTIEATREAEDAWVEHVNALAAPTLYPTCNSWYLGANIPGKPRVFMPHIGFPHYVERCDEVAERDYEGFSLG